MQRLYWCLYSCGCKPSYIWTILCFSQTFVYTLLFPIVISKKMNLRDIILRLSTIWKLEVSKFQDLYVVVPLRVLLLQRQILQSTNSMNSRRVSTQIQGSMSCETIAPIIQETVYENSCNKFMSSVDVVLHSRFVRFLLWHNNAYTIRSATLRSQIFIVTPNPAASRAASKMTQHSATTREMTHSHSRK